MLTPQKLLIALVELNDSKLFLETQLREEYFKDPEVKALHNFIHSFVKIHGTIPTKETITDNLLIDLVEVTEPYTYYLSRVEAKYQYSLFNSTLKASSDLLHKKELPELVDLFSSTVDKIKGVTSNVTYLDVIENGPIITKINMDKNFHEDIVIRTGWPYIDGMGGGMRQGDVISIIGRPGCLSGDTKIYISRKPLGAGRWYSLKQIYRGMSGLSIKDSGKGSGHPWDLSILTKTQCLMGDDLTGLNTIEECLCTGIKKTYTLITSSGKTVRATKDHMFLTPYGYTRLGDLSIGDEIICKNKGVKTGKSPVVSRKEICTKLPYSPYPIRVINGCTYHRVMEQRAVFDAAINGLSLNAFIEKLKYGSETPLVFSSPNLSLHNLDGDYTNAEQGTKPDIDATISKPFKLTKVFPESITSITYYGEEETYDLVMKNPYNNFLAGGMVTHNSGKTMLTLYVANDIVFKQGKRLLYYSTEMSSDQLMERIAAIYTSKTMSYIQTGEMSTWYKNQFFEKLKEMGNCSGLYHIIDGSQGALTVEDIALNVSAVKPHVVIVDGAYLLAHKDPKIDRYRKVAENVETLKRIASANKIPILCSFQFSREATKKKAGEKVGLGDIAYSDAIGQISSIVLGLFQSGDATSAANNSQTRTVEILKGRNGESGEFVIQWDFETSNFSQFIVEEEVVYN